MKQHTGPKRAPECRRELHNSALRFGDPPARASISLTFRIGRVVRPERYFVAYMAQDPTDDDEILGGRAPRKFKNGNLVENLDEVVDRAEHARREADTGSTNIIDGFKHLTDGPVDDGKYLQPVPVVPALSSTIDQFGQNSSQEHSKSCDEGGDPCPRRVPVNRVTDDSFNPSFERVHTVRSAAIPPGFGMRRSSSTRQLVEA